MHPQGALIIMALGAVFAIYVAIAGGDWSNRYGTCLPRDVHCTAECRSP